MSSSSGAWEDGVLDLQVVGMRLEASGVIGLTLRDPEDRLLPPWEPGSHIDLGLPETVRQYSLCGDPRDRRRYEIAILREPKSRGGSSYIHGRLRLGELVEVGGPRNHFELVDAPGYVFIAGGIGITPLLAMIARADREERDWHLHYGGRSRGSMAFVQRLSQWGDRVSVVPEDEQGFIDVAGVVGCAPPNYAIYACGPGPLLDVVTAAAAANDRPVHLERFAAIAADSFGPRRPFTAICQRSGLTLRVSTEQTLLESLEQAGLLVPNACREGVCGSCEVTVLNGQIEHRDSLDGPGSTTRLLACVSRALDEELQLDI